MENGKWQMSSPADAPACEMEFDHSLPRMPFGLPSEGISLRSVRYQLCAQMEFGPEGNGKWLGAGLVAERPLRGVRFGFALGYLAWGGAGRTAMIPDVGCQGGVDLRFET